MNRRIISIAAAPGWKARVADDVMPEGFRVVTLISWALVEGNDGATEIVGVIQRAEPTGSLAFADEVEGFGGYAFTGLATRDIQAE